MIFNKNFYAAAFIAIAFALTACEDEPDKYRMTDGAPSIDYIRPAAASASDSLLTGAYMGSSLCIVGNNLRSVYELWFNDQQATLNTSYMTDHTILVDVPGNIPAEVSDKMYFITKQRDTVTYDFSVLIPGPSITSMSCEYAPAGSVATLFGDYFVDDPNVPLSVTFADHVKVTDIREITKTSVRFVVPEGAVEGKVEVTTIYGSEKSPFNYLDTRGLLFDFDGVTGLGNHGWHNQVIETDETAIAGNFLRLGDPGVTMTASGGWNDGNYSFEYWPGNYTDPLTYTGDGIRLTDLVDFSAWQNMSLKFEMYIPSANPWGAGMMQLIVGGVEKVSYGAAGVKDVDGKTTAGSNNSYFQTAANLPRGIYQPWTPGSVFDTDDEWITVTAPYSAFTYNFDGSAASGSLAPDDFTSLVIFVVGGVEGVECQPVIKIDNIRAVPNK